MELTVLAVPDCPNVALLKDRLEQIEPGLGSHVPVREINNEEEAAAHGMYGSPILLVDGTDPFAAPDAPTGLACRVYRDEHGHAVGAPSIVQLRQALHRQA